MWGPDALGSICFLVSSELAYAEVCHRWICLKLRSLSWRIVTLNLLGSLAFGAAAIASLIEPSSGEPLSARLANGGTAVGGLCFLVAALALMAEAAGDEHAAPVELSALSPLRDESTAHPRHIIAAPDLVGATAETSHRGTAPHHRGGGSMTPDDKQSGMDKPELTSEQIEREGSSFGNRFLLEPAPDNALPKTGMPPQDAMRLVGEEILLDGLPMRNLATFVTTWMEPEATRADHWTPCTPTSSITPSTRRPPRSSSAASA